MITPNILKQCVAICKEIVKLREEQEFEDDDDDNDDDDENNLKND